MAGISGVAVAVATGGALLVYAGFADTNPLQALRAVSGGKPAPVSKEPPVPAQKSGWSGGNSAVPRGGAHPEFVQAAFRRGNEIYSQAKRWADGYSDCSSFIGKSLKDNGITPPGTSVTMSYRSWSALTTISRAEMGAGDLLCGSGHVAFAINNVMAIGQQRSGVNVKVDTIENIMFGQSGWVPRRYTGSSGKGMAA